MVRLSLRSNTNYTVEDGGEGYATDDTVLLLTGQVSRWLCRH